MVKSMTTMMMLDDVVVIVFIVFACDGDNEDL